MSKNKYLSDEERALFRKAMSDVKPLKTTKTQPIQPTENAIEPKATLAIPIKKRIHISIKTPPPAIIPEKMVTGADTLSFCKPGIQHKLYTQLKQGKLPLEATLDLHSYTAEQAIQATDDFLVYCRTEQYRVVCIVHGKGLSSKEAPIIKNVLNHYLRQHNDVLAFHSAKQKDGGTGALYVLLRK